MSDKPPPPLREDARLGPKDWGVLVANMSAVGLNLLNTQSTTFGLADIRGGVGASVDLGAWIPAAYDIGDLLIIPFTLLLARIFSPRWWLVANVLLYAAFCLLAVPVRDVATLLVLRFLQGLTGGALSPLALYITFSQFTGGKKPVGLTAYGLVATATLPLTAAVSGLVATSVGGLGLFVLSAAPALVCVVLAVLCLPKDKMDFSQARGQDWMGALIYGAALACLTAAMTQSVRLYGFASGTIAALSFAGAALLLLFVVSQLTAKKPLVLLKTFGQIEFSVGMVINVLLRFGLLAYASVLPFYAEGVHGWRPEQFGQALLWVSLPQVTLAPLVLYLGERIDERWLMTFGLGLIAGGCFLGVQVDPGWGLTEWTASFLLQGMGQAFSFVPLLLMITAKAKPETAQTFNVIFNSVRDFATVVATFVVGWLVFFRGRLHSARLAESSASNHPFFGEGLAGLAQRYGPQTAGRFAAQELQRQTTVLTTSDLLLVLGLIIAAGIVAVWLLPPPPPELGLWETPLFRRRRPKSAAQPG